MAKSYLFDCGNSTDGPIGFCARVTAKDETEALARLENFMLQRLGPEKDIDIDGATKAGGIEYFTIYFGAENLNPDNINLQETEDICPDCGWNEGSCMCDEDICPDCEFPVGECSC